MVHDTQDQDELYEFQDGIFIAHRQIEPFAFKVDGIIKILPDDVQAIEVEETENCLYVLDPTSTVPAPPTWRVVDDADEMEEWLLRCNKRHLQQMYVEERPPTTPVLKGLMSNHGTSKTADKLLSGELDISNMRLGEEVE